MEYNRLDAVKEVQNKLYDDNTIYDLAELYKVFGDSTRTKILISLEISPLCVDDIALCLNMTKSAVSHQLAYLKNLRLIKSRKDGKEVYYSLDDDHVNILIKSAWEHVTE